MNRHRIDLLSTVLALVLASPSALAQPRSATPPAQDGADEPARRLFEEGTADLNAGRLAEAETRLRAAWQRKRSFDVAGNLGAALLQLDRPAEAAEMLSYAVENFPAGGKPSVKKEVLELLAQAKRAAVTLRLQASADGAEVRVNGQLVGTAPLAREVYAAPGAIVVAVTREGFEPGRVERRGEAGATLEIAVVLRARPAPVELVLETRRPTWPAYASGAAGAAALVTGAVLLGAARAPEGDLQRTARSIRASGLGCPADPRCADLASKAGASDTMSRTGVGMLVGGAVLGAAAGVYWFWPSARHPASGVRVVPVASSEGGGVFASGRF